MACVNALFGGHDNKSIHERECEWLRNRAYQRCIENADYKRVDKIIDGIINFRINKDNFWDEIRKFTKNIHSDHSLGRWLILSEWFYKEEWFS